MNDFVALLRDAPDGGGRVVVETGEIATIRLDHAATRNALDPHMMWAFSEAVAAVRGARVVLLGGESGTFCSGGNLAAVRRHLAVPGMGRQFGAFMQGCVGALADGDAVVIGVLEGAALGGGAELLTACQEVIATPTARVGFVHARLGVSPGFGGGSRLVERVGPKVALKLLSEAEMVDVATLVKLGFVDEVAEAPWEAARARAESFLKLPAAAVAGARRVVRGAFPREAALAEELEVFAALWGGPDHQRALSR